MAIISGYDMATTSSGSVDWQSSNNMSRTTGRKGSTEYIFKLYARYPDRAAFTPRAYDAAVARCRDVHRKLTQLNKALKAGDGGSGQLAYATEIIDNKTGSDQGIIEVVPMVKGGLSLDQYTGSPESRLQLLESLTQAVVRLHSAHIRHADLKLENALFVRNGSSLKVILIDFDHSTPENEVPHPDFTFGTDGYLPPEALAYFHIEDDEDEELMAKMQSRITCKSDIFALGMMFYLLLTLEKASVDPNTAAYRINLAHPSLGGYLTELIAAMVSPDPDDRPSAEEVLESLQTKSFVDKLPPLEALWPEHEGYRLSETNPTNTLRIRRLRRCDENGEKCYKLTLERASDKTAAGTTVMNFTMMRNSGFLISKTRTASARSVTSASVSGDAVDIPGYTILCKGLSPEDRVAWEINTARMNKYYRSIYHCQSNSDGSQTYVLIKANGSFVIRSLINLRHQNLVQEKK